MQRGDRTTLPRHPVRWDSRGGGMDECVRDDVLHSAHKVCTVTVVNKLIENRRQSVFIKRLW